MQPQPTSTGPERSGSQITYSFRDHAQLGQYDSPKSGLAPRVAKFSPFTAGLRSAARGSMQMPDDLIAPSFVARNGQGAASILFMTW